MSFVQVAPFVLKQMKKFDDIEKTENKAAFISGISLFFLALADDYFDEYKEFTIKTIQHPNGSVRQAIIHASSGLLYSLDSRISPVFRPRWKKKIKDSEKEKEIAKKQFMDFVLELESLIEKYDDGKELGEYVDEMKPSIHKSLQVLRNEFAGSHCYRRLIE